MLEKEIEQHLLLGKEVSQKLLLGCDRLFCPSIISRMSCYHCLDIQRSFEFCVLPSSTIPKESHRVSPKRQGSQSLLHLHSTHFLASFKSTQSSPSHPGPVEMTPGRNCKEKTHQTLAHVKYLRGQSQTDLFLSLGS